MNPDTLPEHIGIAAGQRARRKRLQVACIPTVHRDTVLLRGEERCGRIWSVNTGYLCLCYEGPERREVIHFGPRILAIVSTFRE